MFEFIANAGNSTTAAFREHKTGSIVLLLTGTAVGYIIRPLIKKGIDATRNSFTGKATKEAVLSMSGKAKNSKSLKEQVQEIKATGDEGPIVFIPDDLAEMIVATCDNLNKMASVIRSTIPEEEN